ncbi:unnamed protein product [Phytophthora lilii]|uniref:Unnamed protein product n=1 Tax=Phytophthora lilii TaxID=2077276 RepID=A0A9W6UFR8_9STRA|nr:unnamed protein product [Phytophthora lilii]
MSDASVLVRPSTTDWNVEARPQTTDTEVDERPKMADAGTDSRVETADAETNTRLRLVDTEDQVVARSWIKNLYTANANWAALGVKPIKRKTGREDNRYCIGDKGSLIVTRTSKKSKTYQSIDWVATEQKLRDIWYEGESNTIDELSDMRLEDPLYHASLMKQQQEKEGLEKQRFARKRKREKLEDLSVILKKP